nr:MAG TPA: hypothetical protein [Bacteriophage sp.]
MERRTLSKVLLELKKRMVSMSLMTSRLRMQNCKVVLKQSL